jgi:hypothetical protein
MRGICFRWCVVEGEGGPGARGLQSAATALQPAPIICQSIYFPWTGAGTRLCQTGRTGHGSHPGSRVSGILSGCAGLRTGTGGVAMLNPRLLSDIPSGCNHTNVLTSRSGHRQMVAVPACRRAWVAIPEGYQNVAGGRSRAETSGSGTDRIAHPGRVPERGYARRAGPVMDRIPDRAFLASFRDAPACGRGTGGVAMLNPRLLSDIPSGCNHTNVLTSRSGHRQMVAVPACRRAWVAIPEGYQNVAGGRSRAGGNSDALTNCCRLFLWSARDPGTALDDPRAR